MENLENSVLNLVLKISPYCVTRIFYNADQDFTLFDLICPKPIVSSMKQKLSKKYKHIAFSNLCLLFSCIINIFQAI